MLGQEGFFASKERTCLSWPDKLAQLSRSTLKVTRHVSKVMMEMKCNTMCKKVWMCGDSFWRRMARFFIFSGPFERIRTWYSIGDPKRFN